MRANLVEYGTIGILLVATSLRAANVDGGFLLAFLHASFLFLGFAVARHLISRISDRLGRLLFAVTATVLIAESAVQFLSGLHINWFVVSLLLQAQASLNTGVSIPLLLAMTLVSIAGFWILSKKTEQYSKHPRLGKLFGFALATLASTQILYGISYFQGTPEIMQVRRNLPFFWAPHPYRSNKLLGFVLGPRGENPFSVSRVDAPHSTPPGEQADTLSTPINIATAPDILLVVTDSLRSKEIIENPSLAPNLMAAAGQGFFTLDHYSASNCTHFSMYSMMTGKLATGYGIARRGERTRGILARLASAGYRISTAEAASLDWYDLSEVLLPASTERWIAGGSDIAENDIAVEQQTLAEIESWRRRDKPTFHIAYLQGTHFPYSASFDNAGDTNLQRYKATIRQFDVIAGRILEKATSAQGRRETLVIVTSDHGEEFLKDGRVGHASRLSDEQVKVPLLILGASDMKNPIKSHLDIPGVITGAIGIEPSPYKSGDAIILAGCDYDYPSSFSVLTREWRQDFLYDDGYLVPVNDAGEIDAEKSLAAATILLKQLRKD